MSFKYNHTCREAAAAQPLVPPAATQALTRNVESKARGTTTKLPFQNEQTGSSLRLICGQIRQLRKPPQPETVGRVGRSRGASSDIHLHGVYPPAECRNSNGEPISCTSNTLKGLSRTLHESNDNARHVRGVGFISSTESLWSEAPRTFTVDSAFGWVKRPDGVLARKTNFYTTTTHLTHFSKPRRTKRFRCKQLIDERISQSSFGHLLASTRLFTRPVFGAAALSTNS